MWHIKNIPSPGILFFHRIVLVLWPPPSKSLPKQQLLPMCPSILLTRCHGYSPRSKSCSYHLWTESYQMVRAAKHAKLCLPALPRVGCNLYSTVCSLACSIPPQLSVPSLKQLNFKLLNHGHWKTNPNTLSKGMPRQPCLANNKPWWGRRTCLSGWLPGEWNDLLQPSKQGHSDGDKGTTPWLSGSINNSLHHSSDGSDLSHRTLKRGMAYM